MINYGQGTKKKRKAKRKTRRSRSTKRKSRRKSSNQIMDVIYKGKKIKTIREYSFDNERPANKSHKRKLRSLNTSFRSYRSKKSQFNKARRKRSRSNFIKPLPVNQRTKRTNLNTSRSMLNSGGKQQSYKQLVFEL